MKKDTLKISVVTVCYNAEETLARTLASVAKQTYTNVEHILIDGGSKDQTMVVAKNYGAHLIKTVSETDEGTYDAMNKGLRYATGDVVAFLNADDFYASDKILGRVAEMMLDRELDILMGNVAFFKEGREDRIVRVYDSGHFHFGKLAKGWMPAHPALFVRREALVCTGGFKKDYKIAGDFELVARLLMQKKFKSGFLPEILVKMQMGGISTSGWKARWLINKEILRACKENGIKTSMWKLLLRYPKKILEIRGFFG